MGVCARCALHVLTSTRSFKRCRRNDRQCRCWSDCCLGAVWSGSALFVQICLVSRLRIFTNFSRCQPTWCNWYTSGRGESELFWQHPPSCSWHVHGNVSRNHWELYFWIYQVRSISVQLHLFQIIKFNVKGKEFFAVCSETSLASALYGQSWISCGWSRN